MPSEPTAPAPSTASDVADVPAPPTALPRVLGPFDAFTLVVGGIVGSGIFLKPPTNAAALGDFRWIIFVWVAVGAVSLFGALTIAELAVLLPRAGGPYVYLREAFGRLPAFLWGWTEFWVNRTGSLGALATACVVFLAQIVRLSYVQQEIAVLTIVAGLAVANAVGTRVGAGVQNLTASLKMLFIVALVVLPMVLGFASPSNLATTAPPAGSLWMGLGVALASVWWAYDGWANLGPVAEEVRDPNRNVPRALFLGVGAVALLYCAATLSYHLVLPMDKVAKSSAVLTDVFSILFGSVGLYIGAAGVALSTFGAASANLIIGPRIVFAMARDGLLPGILGRIHQTAKSPANAVIVQALWAMVMVHVAFTIAEPNKSGVPDVRKAFDKLTDFAIFGSSIFYAFTVAAVYVLRRRMPDAPRPYRTWGYPVTPALFLVAFVALQVSLFVKDPIQCLSGFLLIGAGAVYYLWAVRRPAARSPTS